MLLRYFSRISESILKYTILQYVVYDFENIVNVSNDWKRTHQFVVLIKLLDLSKARHFSFVNIVSHGIFVIGSAFNSLLILYFNMFWCARTWYGTWTTDIQKIVQIQKDCRQFRLIWRRCRKFENFLNEHIKSD